MHDTYALEAAGVPSVIIASTEFRDAVSQGSRGLGFNPAVVFVEHPIQDRSDAEMAALAEAALGEILAALTLS